MLRLFSFPGTQDSRVMLLIPFPHVFGRISTTLGAIHNHAGVSFIKSKILSDGVKNKVAYNLRFLPRGYGLLNARLYNHPFLFF